MIRAVLAVLLLIAGASLLPARAHGGPHAGPLHPVAFAPVAVEQPAMPIRDAAVITVATPARPDWPCHQPVDDSGQLCCCATACVAVLAPPMPDLPAAPSRLAWGAGFTPALVDFYRDPPRPPPRG